uniref:Retrotransposon Copia-like N-terminal domain-containing protein n=1 Tax=Fagus sylvatica TaxID=28930 RepID=A0A2N9EH09_FAGSY
MVSEPTMASDASAISSSSDSSPLQRDESTNQLFLHHGNSPSTILVSQPLSGENYNTWSRSMIMALTAKNKIVSKDIASSVIYANTAQEMWEDLKERFAQGNGPRVFEIQKAISSLTQDQCNVSVYFTKLKSLWDELNNYRSEMPRHNYGGRGQFGKKDRPMCSHCGVAGHIVDKCYKLHGFPPRLQIPWQCTCCQSSFCA